MSKERREARQRRIQTILEWTGLPSGGVGIVATINFLRNGQWLAATGSGLVSIAVIFLAIGGKFVKDLTNKVLDKVEERLEQNLVRLVPISKKYLFSYDFWPKVPNRYLQRLFLQEKQLKILVFGIF